MITKHRTGYLFKRGENYYVATTVEGEKITRALRDDNGNPITIKRDAEQAKDKFMATFTVSDKVEALQSLAGKLSDSQEQLAAIEDAQNPALSLKQAWAEYRASVNRPNSGEATLYQYECQWTAFQEWMEKQHPELTTLRAVTVDIAEEYMGTLNHGRFSPNTYNKHLNLLTLVFRVLSRKAKLTENHWEGIQRKELTTQSRRELTLDELKKVCQSATGELRTLLAIGVYCGLRLGDCATLRNCEIDLKRNVVVRVPNKTARRNPKPVIIPIHPVLSDILGSIPEVQRGEYVLPETAALYHKRDDMVTDLVQNHFKACDIKTHKPGTGKDGKRAVIEVGFHSLRHSFVSLCRESNAPLAVVESIVGHSNPAMTRHYTHVGELAAGRAIALLPTVIGEAKAEPAKRDDAAILREVKSIVESMTAKNWRTQRDALVSLVTA
jgi:integrase